MIKHCAAINNQFSDQDDEIDVNEDIEEVVDGIISSLSQQNDNWYVQEAVHANLDSGYFSSPSNREMAEVNTYHYCPASMDEMKRSIEMVKIQIMESAEATTIAHSLRELSIFVTGPAEIEAVIQEVIQKFTLNREQSRALHIIAHHSLGISRVGDQLLMG